MAVQHQRCEAQHVDEEFALAAFELLNTIGEYMNGLPPELFDHLQPEEETHDE